MNLRYIKAVDILPGDMIAFSIKTDKDKYSKVKYMIVDDTVEDEFESGEPAVACHGRIYMQPADIKRDVSLSTIKKQKLHLKEEATILLLKRESVEEVVTDITGLVPMYTAVEEKKA
jgi:hypothetical protein